MRAQSNKVYILQSLRNDNYAVRDGTVELGIRGMSGCLCLTFRVDY